MHTAKPDAHRKAGCTPQSRMHTAKPDAHRKAERRRQNKSGAPVTGRSAYLQAAQAPI
ncbi:hypothetical protein HMPREF9720_1621 [Alistipes sp. HGB5]|nr:hypothetical protein HMPREF9720_1621 [Alistipes sp. HGB5]